MTLSTIADISQIVSVPIAVISIYISAYLVIKQLINSRNNSIKEFNIRRKEITLNAYNSIRDILRDISNKIKADLGINDIFGIINQEQIQKIIHNTELENKIRKMLGIYERFAVGVKHNIYCLDMIYDISGTVFISTFNQFKPYIDYVRKKENRPYIKEFEVLVAKLESKRNENNNINKS